MAWFPAPIDVSAELAWVESADLDGDGREELILATREPDGERPMKLTLHIHRFDTKGVLAAKSKVSLGNKATFIEADAGLWGLDGDGFLRWSPDGTRTRLLSASSPLGGLGPATPRRAELAEDLNGDSVVELLAWANGKWCVYSSEGSIPHCVSAPAQGDLSASEAQGGARWSASTRSPPLALGDIDGDGTTDLLLPEGRSLRVAFGPSWDQRSATWALPLDLDPPQAKGGEAREDVADVIWRDIDGDGRCDLLVHIFRSSGGFFDGESELRLYRSVGAGFEPARSFKPGAAVTSLELQDLEGDGDLDLLMLRADISFSNVARSLLAKQVAVDLLAFRWEGKSLSSPTVLRTLNAGLQDFRLPYAMKGDLDGDGTLDLVVEESGELRLYLGTETGLASSSSGAVKLTHRVEELTVVDTDGDGRSEVLAWAEGGNKTTLLRWR